MFITGHLLRLCLPKATKATSLNLAVQPTLSSQPSISSSQRLEMSFEERSHELRAPLVASPLEELESLLMKMKEESEKTGLNLNTQKTKITASSPMTSWQIDGETLETETLFSWPPKSLQMVSAAIKLKDICSLEEKL